jgi:hypothetical protein
MATDPPAALKVASSMIKSSPAVKAALLMTRALPEATQVSQVTVVLTSKVAVPPATVAVRNVFNKPSLPARLSTVRRVPSEYRLSSACTRPRTLRVPMVST